MLDICIGGVMEHLFRGNRDPGPDRLKAAAAPASDRARARGLDILSTTVAGADMLERPRTRVQYVQDKLRVQVRTTADELRQAADVQSPSGSTPRAASGLPRAEEGLVVARQGGAGRSTTRTTASSSSG